MSPRPAPSTRLHTRVAQPRDAPPNVTPPRTCVTTPRVALPRRFSSRLPVLQALPRPCRPAPLRTHVAPRARSPAHILHSAPPESLHLVFRTADSRPSCSTSGPRPTARRPAPRWCTSPRPTSLHLTGLCPRALSGAMWVAARGLWGHPAGLWTVLGGRKAGLLPGGVRGLHGSPVSCGKNLLKKFASKTK